MPEGGLLLINTNRPIDYMLQFIPNADMLGCVATIDADGISGSARSTSPVRKVEWTRPVLGAGIAAPILGALARVTGMAKKENLAKIVSDVAAMERGYNEVKLEKFRKARVEYSWGT